MCEIDIERLREENRILCFKLEQAEYKAKVWKDAYEKQTELMHRLFDIELINKVFNGDNCFND